MATTNDLKNGMVLKLEGQLWTVVEFQHVKPGKGPAFVRTKLKHVESGKLTAAGSGRHWMGGEYGEITGPNAYEYDGPNRNPYVQEHADLIGSIRRGEGHNEGVQVAHSTLSAIAGRMAAYTGRSMKWEWALRGSELDLTPPEYAFGDLPAAPPAVPGVTKLV